MLPLAFGMAVVWHGRVREGERGAEVERAEHDCEPGCWGEVVVVLFREQMFDGLDVVY